MSIKDWAERLREGKNGVWLWALLAVMVLAALLSGKMQETASVSQQEARIAQVLSLMEGAGRVEAVLFYPEKAGSLWQEETKTIAPTGAVIVAQGADQIEVRLHLTRAASTLLGLEADKIGVFPMEGE